MGPTEYSLYGTFNLYSPIKIFLKPYFQSTNLGIKALQLNQPTSKVSCSQSSAGKAMLLPRRAFRIPTCHPFLRCTRTQRFFSSFAAQCFVSAFLSNYRQLAYLESIHFLQFLPFLTQLVTQITSLLQSTTLAKSTAFVIEL